jgi:hypothetical protein
MSNIGHRVLNGEVISFESATLRSGRLASDCHVGLPPPRNDGVGGRAISDCRLGPSTRLRLAQDDLRQIAASAFGLLAMTA